MDESPTRASVTFTGETLRLLRETAAQADISANELAIGLVRDGLVAIHADSPKQEVGMVLLMRRALRKDLSAVDKMAYEWLEKHFPRWAEQTQEYRRLTVRIASQVGELDAKTIKKAADEAWAIVQQRAKGGSRRRSLAKQKNSLSSDIAPLKSDADENQT